MPKQWAMHSSQSSSQDAKSVFNPHIQSHYPSSIAFPTFQSNLLGKNCSRNVFRRCLLTKYLSKKMNYLNAAYQPKTIQKMNFLNATSFSHHITIPFTISFIFETPSFGNGNLVHIFFTHAMTTMQLGTRGMSSLPHHIFPYMHMAFCLQGEGGQPSSLVLTSTT